MGILHGLMQVFHIPAYLNIQFTLVFTNRLLFLPAIGDEGLHLGQPGTEFQQVVFKIFTGVTGGLDHQLDNLMYDLGQMR